MTRQVLRKVRKPENPDGARESVRKVIGLIIKPERSKARPSLARQHVSGGRRF